MTREEAALKLSFHLMQCGMLMPIEWVEQNGEGSELSEAFRMAISALREQEQRSTGCEWCESLDKKNRDFKCGDILARGVVEHTFWGDGRWYMREPKFCPMCGRRLEEV